MVMLCWLLEDPGQVALLAVTVIKPCMKLLLEFIVIELVPCPDTKVNPVGTVQLKVALAIAVTLYTKFVELPHTVVSPDMADGVGGASLVTHRMVG
jgi:hypothetical protein